MQIGRGPRPGFGGALNKDQGDAAPRPSGGGINPTVQPMPKKKKTPMLDKYEVQKKAMKR